MVIQGHVGLLKEGWDDEAQRMADFAVIEQELARRGIGVTEQEILEAAQFAPPPDYEGKGTGSVLVEVEEGDADGAVRLVGLHGEVAKDLLLDDGGALALDQDCLDQPSITRVVLDPNQ